jgi:cysteine desulfurase
MIYLDNAASTRVADEVIALMSEIMRDDYANPSAGHPAGAAARRRIAAARAQVLAAVGDPDGALGDVVWTSGGTEANALGVLGAARAGAAGGVVVSALEHPAVAASAAQLGAGYPVRVAGVDGDGVIDVDGAAALVDRDTRVVATMLVSNELGSVQPVAAIARAARARAAGVHVHCDATQALGKIEVDVGALAVDSLGIAGHKLHGPKGVGALWLRHGAALAPLWGGGGQQGGRRHGTQDAPGAAGLGLAAARAVARRADAEVRWRAMADVVTAAVAATGVRWRRLGGEPRAPHILALAIDRVAADALRMVLASRGVIASSGSACAALPGADAAAKHGALGAIGLPPSWGMVRLSFGLDTRADDVAAAAPIIATALRELAGA